MTMPHIATPPGGSYPRLVGDIGGTHARFARVSRPGGALADISVHDCEAFDGLEALLRFRLARDGASTPRGVALGVATPVTGDVVNMTNRDWSFSISAVRDRLGLDRLLILNDFETLARALPSLPAAALHRIGDARQGDGASGTTRAVLGPGTGLGVGGLAADGSRTVPVVGEGGHVTLAPEDALEDRVLQQLRLQFGHVSAERVLSGPGLGHLHAALCAIAGVDAEALSPSEISGRALAGTDPHCVEAVARFLGWLGAVAGDIALTLGARGGVYIGGGVVPQLLPLLAGSAFRSRFENKGRFETYMRAIPTWLITDASEAALHGANLALDEPVRSSPP